MRRGMLGVASTLPFSYPEGSHSSCVIDPTHPPNPCSELAANPGPPIVEIEAPQALLGEDGGLVGFVPELALIGSADGSQRSSVLDPAFPPSPYADPTR